nr:MAG TPA: hypothetical protein [Caudoviricetes sp.]
MKKNILFGNKYKLRKVYLCATKHTEPMILKPESLL